MSKKLLFFIALLSVTVIAVCDAQYTSNQDKIWAFGWGAGINFTSGSPVAISTSMNTNEGCASVCDAFGSLLFYTDGDTVYNRSGAIMPSGAHITTFWAGTTSTTQAAVIIPVIGNANQYYIFSLESYQIGTGRLEYCIVDMTLAGGMGDVVASTRSTLLDTLLGEHMAVVQGNSCNVWLLTHRQDSTKFRAYNITSTGISGPVVSSVGTFTAYGGYSIGHLMSSPDRTKLISTTYNLGTYVAHGVGTELYNFDPNSGIVYNCQVLDSTGSPYSCEFSPDGTKAYTCVFDTTAKQTFIYQYDVSLGSTAAIIGSRYTVHSSSFWDYPYPGSPPSGVYCSMRLGPDGIIYLGAMDSVVVGFLDCIPNPNVGGSGCGYTYHDVTLVSGTNFVFGLPALYYVQGAGDTIFHSQDTTVCSSVGSITLSAPVGYTDYLWSNGASSISINVSASGNYIAYCDSGCQMLVDTFNTTFNPYSLTTNIIDTFFCFPGQFILQAPTGYSTTTWQSGITASTFTDTAAGTFYVDASSYCADYIDTFHISAHSLSIDLGPDPTVCMNYEIRVPLGGKDISYLWQDGTTDSVYSADHTGTYFVTVHQYGCEASDTINVTFTHLTQDIPDTFVCKGSPINYKMQCNLPDGGSVMWNDGVTSPVRTVHDSGTWWVYVSYGQCEILDTVRVTTGYCNCWLDMPSGFTPNGDGLNDVFRPTIEPGCPVSGYLFSVYNRWGQLVFSSDRQGVGWDGTFKGVPCDIDTYMYSLTYFSGVNNTPITQNGTATLIR